MAGNSLLNVSMIAKEMLRVLKNNTAFSSSINRQYDDQFANSGAMIGSVINIRKPTRFTVTDGQALNVQDVADQSVALTLDTQKHVGFQFSSKELTLNIEEFSKRYVTPAAAALGNKIDVDGLAQYVNVWNSVGVPGTTPATSLVFLQAGQKLDENGCPMDDQRTVIINPAAQAATVDALKGLFQQSDAIGEQYMKGRMGKGLGFTWKMDQNVAVRVTGESHALSPLVNTTSSADGDTTIVTDVWGGTVVNAVKKGDVFTIGSVNAVNPQSRISTGSLQQFVVTADGSADSGGNLTISFQPALQSTGAYQNIDSLPVDEAAITFVERVADDGTSTPQNIAFHKDAFVLGMADLILPGGVDMAARASDPESGISIRLVRAYDISNDRLPMRCDILYGYKTLFPELACRIQG